jgi:TfoX/Sxy family transcriptional regulator of competence genes
MGYDESVADRVRKALAGVDGVSEKKMFGGIAFMVRGNMCCGVIRDKLMVRVGPEAYGSMLEKPHVHEMDFTGRPLTGFLYVEAQGFGSSKELKYWVRMATGYALSLPAKG